MVITALSKKEGPDICWGARFLIFLKILISCLLEKGFKNRASLQAFGPSFCQGFSQIYQHFLRFEDFKDLFIKNWTRTVVKPWQNKKGQTLVGILVFWILFPAGRWLKSNSKKIQKTSIPSNVWPFLFRQSFKNFDD